MACHMVLGHRNAAALNPTWNNLGISRGNISQEVISPLLLSKGHGMWVRKQSNSCWERSEDTQKVDPKFLISSPMAINSAQPFHISFTTEKLIQITQEGGGLCLPMVFIGQNKKAF